MLDWIKNINKEYPVFWKEYLSKFDKKSKRFVVLSTKTSGLNPNKDFILSIGSFAVIDNCILIGDSFEAILDQNNKISDEFYDKSKLQYINEAEAIKTLIEFIGNSVLVGYHIDFNVEIINTALEKLNCGSLKNEALDVDLMHRKLFDGSNKQISLQELSDFYKIPKSEKNSSSEDAYKIALLFIKIKSRLGLS